MRCVCGTLTNHFCHGKFASILFGKDGVVAVFLKIVIPLEDHDPFLKLRGHEGFGKVEHSRDDEGETHELHGAMSHRHPFLGRGEDFRHFRRTPQVGQMGGRNPTLVQNVGKTLNLS